MIEKLLGLKNLGVLQAALPSGAVELRKCTVIYGENGRGKTTLARLLASLATGDCSCLRSMSSIGSAGEPAAELLVSRSQYSLRSYCWTPQPLQTVVVFNTDFVHRNVFTGTSVEPDHRRNLCSFAVGEEGVSLAKTVERLNGEIKETTRRIAETEREVSTLVGKAMTVDQFLSLPEDAGIDGKIAQASRTAAAARNAVALREHPGLQHIDLQPSPSPEQVSMLGSTVEELASDAAARTRLHIRERLGMGGEEWLRLGLGYLRDERCPFCDQGIAGLDLVDAFRGYFSEAYAQFRQRVAAAAAATEAASSQLLLQQMRTLAAENEAVVEFWTQYVSLPPLNSPLKDIEAATAAIREGLLPAFERKLSDPLSPAEPDIPLDRIGELRDAASASIASYNQAAAEANEAIERCRAGALGSSISEAEGSLTRLGLQKKRWEPDIPERCTVLEGLRSKKDEQEKAKTDAKQRLEQHMSQTMTAYQSATNDFLNKCNASFRIVDLEVGFAGGEPRADYNIELFGQRVSVVTRTAEGPHFDTMLSDGDRRTLALAFFLARLERDPALANRVVVLDDPVSSLDMHRTSRAVAETVKLSKRCHQLIVMTHDPLFAMELSDALTEAGMAGEGGLVVLELIRDGTCSTISACNAAELYQTLLQRSIQTLEAFVDGPAGVATVDAVKSIRPAIEGLLRLKYPKEFRGVQEFGSMVTRIRDADAASRLHRLKDSVDDLFEVGSYYATSYMHIDRPYSAAAPDDSDALPWVRQALSLLAII